MGFRLVPKSFTLNDLERRNHRRPALSLRQLSFLFIVAFIVSVPVSVYTATSSGCSCCNNKQHVWAIGLFSDFHDLQADDFQNLMVSSLSKRKDYFFGKTFFFN